MLLETDQVDCYDADGMRIECAGSGQDGARKEPGSAVRPNRFKSAGDGVQDLMTGLIWHSCANPGEFPLSWEEARSFLEELNASQRPGPYPWRLPTRRELFSLIGHQHVNPALPGAHPFFDIFNGYYWTGTECARLPGQAWYIHLGGGKVYRGMKHAAYMVWPVSGQPAGPVTVSDRFVVGSALFYDKKTERHWYAGDQLTGRETSWETAIDAIRRLNESKNVAYHDWRLPNIRELESLVDDTRHSPALASGVPFNAAASGYWSSTTSVYEPRYAWVLYTLDGAIGVGFKPKADFQVIAVRG